MSEHTADYDALIALIREHKADAWDECTEAHHRYAVAQGLAFAHPPNPYRVTPPEAGQP